MASVDEDSRQGSTAEFPLSSLTQGTTNMVLLTQEITGSGAVYELRLKALAHALGRVEEGKPGLILLDVCQQPELREAMLACSRAILGADTAISGAFGSEERPRPGFLTRRELLSGAALLVESFATVLLQIFGQLDADSRADRTLAYLVGSAAGSVILGSASQAATFGGLQAGGVRRHEVALQQLLQTLSSLEQPAAASALRATACRPEAIVASLRCLHSADCWGGLQGTPDCGLGDCSVAALLLHSPTEVFAPERAAIVADIELQRSIGARAVATLKLFCIAAGGAGGLASPSVDEYMRGASAACVFSSFELSKMARQAWTEGPHIVQILADSTEHFLRLDPPAELGPDGPRMKCECLGSALTIMAKLCYPGPDAAGVLPFRDVLRFLGLASAAGVYLLQALGDDDMPALARGLPGFVVATATMYLGPDNRLPPGTDVGSWAAYHQALEAMLRLAALLLTRLAPGNPHASPELQAHIPYMLQCTAHLFGAVYKCKPAAPDDEQEASCALAGLVGSALKFSLLLSRSAAESDNIRWCSCIFNLVADLRARLKGSELEEGPAKRRWQGLALSAWGIVAFVMASGSSTTIPTCYPLLLPFLRLPIWDLALATAASQKIMLQVCETMLERNRGGPQDEYVKLHLWHGLRQLGHPGTEGPSGAALALGRAGVLLLLVRWAAENCSLPHPALRMSSVPTGLQVLATRAYTVEDKLKFIVAVVFKAAFAVDIQLVSILESIIASESNSIVGFPNLATFWGKVEADVVEPLVRSLEAKAAAGEAEGDAASLAVVTAEALATRPCAHVCCTTIVGAREAETPRGKLCSGCRVVRYCGAGCQKADWPAHKAACRELQRRRSQQAC